MLWNAQTGVNKRTNVITIIEDAIASWHGWFFSFQMLHSLSRYALVLLTMNISYYCLTLSVIVCLCATPS